MKTIQSLLRSPAPQTWLFCGDSVTHGALHTHGYRDYSQIFNERLRYELKRHLDVVINTGVSGNTTTNILDEFDRRIAAFQPQVVVLMIGLNDMNPARGVTPERFEDNLNRLADKCQALNALLWLQTSNTILPGSVPALEANADSYMNTMRTIARERGLPLLDQYALWEEQATSRHMWMNDGIHPNHHGHLFMAFNLFKALGIFDPENSHVCRHYLPRLTA